MATSGNARNVRLDVEIQTAGEQNLAKLAAQVRALAKEGGDAAPEYARLAEALDQLGDEARSLDAVRKFGQDLAATNAAVQEATLRAAALREEYQRQGAAIETARNARAGLQAQLDQVARSLAAEQQQLDLVRASLRDETIDAKAAALAQRELGERVATLTRQKRELQVEVRAAGRALSEASQGYAKLGTAADGASRNAAQLQGTFRAQANSLQDASAAAVAAGVGVTDLAAAQQKLDAALKSTLASVNARADASREQAEADRLAALAARGFAEAQERGSAAAASELAALRDSEQFTQAYAVSKRAASAAALQFVEAEEAAAAAAEQANRRVAELNATAERTRRNADYVKFWAEALDQLDVAALESTRAMQLLEQAGREADAEFSKLAASLQDTERAAREYAAAVERAAAASSDDVAAKQAARVAAERLLETERALTAAGRDLARARDVSRTAALGEAQALLTAARAAEEAQGKIAATAREARRAGQALEQAFGTAGIRSIDAIEREIDQVNRALVVLETRLRAGTLSQQEFDRAAGAAAVRLEGLRREINQVQALPNAFERINTSLNGAITKFGAVTAAAATLGFAVAPVVKSFIALEQATRVLTQITGSAAEAARQVEFLRNVAQRSGQEFDGLAKSYSKFAASALQTGLSTKTIQGVFESVAVAAGNLGLSTDQSSRALEALSQIASKGVAGMEELRQQLGDALPGVLPLLANELGLTTAELNKVVESGQLLATEAIPAIGRALTKLGTTDGKPVEGLVASWNRLKNVIFETTNNLADGGIGRAIGAALEFGSRRIQEFLFLVNLIGESFNVVGRQIGAVMAALVSRDFKNLGQALEEIEQKSRDKLDAMANRITGVGAAAADAGTRTGQAAGAIASSIGQAGESYARLALEQARSIAAAELGTQVAEKRAQASATEYEAAQKVITSLLSETEAIDRQVVASAALLASKVSVSTALQAEANALVAAREAVIAKASADGTAREAIQGQLDVYDKKLAKVQADIAASDAQVLKATELANAAALVAQKFGDQSGRIEEYRNNVEGATRAYEGVVRAFAKGKATTEELAKADEALALAKNLLRDALSDLNAKLEANLKLLRADAELKKRGLELEIAQARNRLAEAQRLGQETKARQELVRILELEQAVRRLSSSSKLQEIELTLKEIDAQEKNLRASGEWTDAKQIEIETRRKATLAQLLEEQTRVESAKAQDKELEAVRSGSSAREEHTGKVRANSDALGANTRSIDANSGSMGRNADATQRAASARERYLQLLREDPDRLVGGSGFGGIGSSGTTPVRQPGGIDNQLSGNGGTDFSVLDRETRTVGSVNYPPPDASGSWQLIPDARASGGTSPTDALAGRYRSGSNDRRYPYAINGVGYWVNTGTAGASGGVDTGVFGSSSTGGSTTTTTTTTPAPAPPGSSKPLASASGGQQTIVLKLGSREATVTADARNAEALLGILQEAERLTGG